MGTTMLPNGIAASFVSWEPNGMLILVRVLIAQPFASRIGAILRLRSFIEAKIIDGPEIHSKIPIRPSGTQKPKPNKACKILPINAEIPPNAVPINAIVPRSSFFEATGAAGAAAVLAAACLSAVVTVDAVLESNSADFASPAAARAAIWLSIIAANCLYGIKKACRTLIGFAITFVTTAFQSLPTRS